MKRLLVTLLSCIWVAYAADITRVDINLDESIRTQYEKIIGNRLPALKTFISSILGLLGNKTQSIVASYDLLVASQPKDWISRIEAIANITGYQPQDLVVFGFFYELSYGCTSIVINNGTEIFMGRNLDFGYKDLLLNMTFEGRYYKNNKLLFIGQGMIGDPGLLNGVRIGQFGMSINQRYMSNTTFGASMTRAFLGGISPSYNILLMMMNIDSYASLVTSLQGVKLTSECYYTACGINKNEGVIITRSPDAVINMETLDMENGKYYLVQTNSDREMLSSDERRKSAESRLDEMKKNSKAFTYSNVYDEVMSKSPNKQVNTIYSTIQSPANSGYTYTNVWSSGAFLQGALFWGLIWTLIILVLN